MSNTIDIAAARARAPSEAPHCPVCDRVRHAMQAVIRDPGARSEGGQSIDTAFSATFVNGYAQGVLEGPSAHDDFVATFCPTHRGMYERLVRLSYRSTPPPARAGEG